MKIIVSLILFFSFLNTNTSEVEFSEDSALSFINPVSENAVVVSNFGLRTHPILNKQRMHTGVDFQIQAGEKVKASEKGKVIFASEKESFGNMVILEHADGYRTRYAHLDSFDKEITVGSEVEKGQAIGFPGKSGLTQNPVLHFEILQDGEAKDPLHFLE